MEGSQRDMRFIDAITEGLRLSMEKHPDLVLMGQDIGPYGGVFKVTDGFVDAFGEERVRNTPLCESAIVGAALGLSIAGKKAMMEMQFSDFVTCGFNQIVNNLAKIHWRWGQAADVVVRMPTGGGVGAGPYHSQSTEAWFFHVPGLKIAYPSTPADAKGLLRMAIDDPNPMLFFEHKLLYRSLTGPCSEEDYLAGVWKRTCGARRGGRDHRSPMDWGCNGPSKSWTPIPSGMWSSSTCAPCCRGTKTSSWRVSRRQARPWCFTKTP